MTSFVRLSSRTPTHAHPRTPTHTHAHPRTPFEWDHPWAGRADNAVCAQHQMHSQPRLPHLPHRPRWTDTRGGGAAAGSTRPMSGAAHMRGETCTRPQPSAVSHCGRQPTYTIAAVTRQQEQHKGQSCECACVVVCGCACPWLSHPQVNTNRHTTGGLADTPILE